MPYIKAFTHLKVINLAHNRISDLNPFEDLAKKSNNALAEIDLDDNMISKIGEITKLKNLQQLRFLKLQDHKRKTDNPICEKAGYEKEILKILPRLRQLNDQDSLLVVRQTEAPIKEPLIDIVQLDPPVIENKSVDVNLHQNKLIEKLYKQLKKQQKTQPRKCQKCPMLKMQIDQYEYDIQLSELLIINL